MGISQNMICPKILESYNRNPHKGYPHFRKPPSKEDIPVFFFLVCVCVCFLQLQLQILDGSVCSQQLQIQLHVMPVAGLPADLRS